MKYIAHGETDLGYVWLVAQWEGSMPKVFLFRHGCWRWDGSVRVCVDMQFILDRLHEENNKEVKK